MSGVSPTTGVSRLTRETRPSIELPDGEVLQPRCKFVRELGITEKSAVRWDLPTVYIGGIAYLARNASLKIIANRVRRRNQPKQRRA